MGLEYGRFCLGVSVLSVLNFFEDHVAREGERIVVLHEREEREKKVSYCVVGLRIGRYGWS